MAIERVLVHPIYSNNPEIKKFQGTWRRWEKDSNTYTIPVDRSVQLSDTRYLSQVSSCLKVGGQAGRVCVATHLRYLAKEQIVKEGGVRLVVSREATLIDDQSLDYILRLIFDESQVNVGVSN